MIRPFLLILVWVRMLTLKRCVHGTMHTWYAAHMVCCTHGMLHTWYAAHMVCCTHGMLHTWYAAHMVCCTHGMLHTRYQEMSYHAHISRGVCMVACIVSRHVCIGCTHRTVPCILSRDVCVIPCNGRQVNLGSFEKRKRGVDLSRERVE